MNDLGFTVNMLPLKGTTTAATTTAAQRYGTMSVAATALSGQLPPPANAAAAAGNSPLNVPQAAMVVGEPIPVVFGRRRGNVGGVLVFPKATEARFENTSTTITARYHCVLGEGLLGDIEVRDVRQGECRPGAVYSQNYNQRAGSWAAGNVATVQSGYSWAPPSFTGGGGNYQGISTIEFSGTYVGGSDQWRTAWNVFVRNGLVIERGRLLDSTAGSSDNVADLILWALQRSGRVPDALIDFDSLTAAARFVEANGLWCNGEFSSSTNLGDWLIKLLPDFLLRETKVAGKFGLRPLLPINSDGSINTGTITPAWSLTEAAIIPGSLQIEYAEASSRRPVAMAMLWRQQQDATDVPIVRSLAVGDVNASGPVEQHDLSQYATTENHAVRVGAYLYARRTLSTHTATVRLKAGSQTGTIAQGDIVQIYLQNISSREPADVFNRYYQVESVAQAISGEETLQLSHFPVDSSGRSLIALAVTRARCSPATAPAAAVMWPERRPTPRSPQRTPAARHSAARHPPIGRHRERLLICSTHGLSCPATHHPAPAMAPACPVAHRELGRPWRALMVQLAQAMAPAAWAPARLGITASPAVLILQGSTLLIWPFQPVTQSSLKTCQPLHHLATLTMASGSPNAIGFRSPT
jgi:hypothetical protein